MNCNCGEENLILGASCPSCNLPIVAVPFQRFADKLHEITEFHRTNTNDPHGISMAQFAIFSELALTADKLVDEITEEFQEDCS